MNASVVEMLVERLADGELVEVAATSVDPDATEVPRKLRRGSRLRKIPQAILRSYQRTSRLQMILEGQPDLRPTPDGLAALQSQENPTSAAPETVGALA